MKDLNPYIKTGTYSDFIDDLTKVYTKYPKNKDLLVKYLSAYYCSNDDNKVSEYDILMLLEADSKYISSMEPHRIFLADKVIYTTLAFVLKDKKFYKTAEMRGIV